MSDSETGRCAPQGGWDRRKHLAQVAFVLPNSFSQTFFPQQIVFCPKEFSCFGVLSGLRYFLSFSGRLSYDACSNNLLQRFSCWLVLFVCRVGWEGHFPAFEKSSGSFHEGAAVDFLMQNGLHHPDLLPPRLAKKPISGGHFAVMRTKSHLIGRTPLTASRPLSLENPAFFCVFFGRPDERNSMAEDPGVHLLPCQAPTAFEVKAGRFFPREKNTFCGGTSRLPRLGLGKWAFVGFEAISRFWRRKKATRWKMVPKFSPTKFQSGHRPSKTEVHPGWHEKRYR